MNCAMTAFEPHGQWWLALSHLQHGSSEMMLVPCCLLSLFGLRGKYVLPCP